MRLVLQLALRNIWRQRRRNGLVLFAVVVCIGGVFVMNALARGMEQDFLRFSIENLRGHVKIISPAQLDDPGLHNSMSSDVDQTALDDPRIAAWIPRLRSPAVIMSERETRGVEIVGIDPLNESHSFIDDLVIHGQALSDGTDSFLMLGESLADELKTTIGRRVVVLMNGAHGEAIETGYQVLGIFKAPNRRYEEAYVLTGIQALQEIADLDGFTDISIHLRNQDLTEEVKATLAPVYPGLSVVTWQELDLFTGEMYRFIGYTVYILVVVFMGTLVFGLINALVTAVLVRLREFGMLRIVGMKSRLVVMQIVVECVLIMVAALVIGLAAGLLIVLWLSDGIDLTAFTAGAEAFGLGSHMVPHLVLGDFVIVAVASVVLGLIASYFPARRIVKTPILRALREG